MEICSSKIKSNPVEYALAALNGCLTTSLIYHAAAQGIKIEEVESILSGDLDLHGFLGMDESVRNGYERINVTQNQVRCSGREVDGTCGVGHQSK